MSITSGVGLVSGIDFESLIAQMSQASRGPINVAQSKINVLSTKNEAYGTVVSQLNNLRTKLAGMIDADAYSERETTSSNADVVSVSGDEDAPKGSYAVRVLQLAQAERIASQGVASLDAPIAAGAGTFEIQAGVAPARSYQIDSATTLAQLRDMINEDETAGVTASIVNDGSASNPYRLVLTGKETGAINDVVVLNNDTTLNLETKTVEAAEAGARNQFDGGVVSSGTYVGSGTTNVVLKMVAGGDVDGAAEFVVSLDGGLSFDYETRYSATSAAQDVSGGLGVEVAFSAGTTAFAAGDTFSIDAFDPQLAEARDAVVNLNGIQIRRSDNTFSDAAPGLTFTAKSVGEGPVTLTVSEKAGVVNAKVVEFQTAFSDMIRTMRTLTNYDAENNKAQPLFGDSAARMVRNALVNVLTSPMDDGAGWEYPSLASIGLRLQADGTLSFDQAKMNEALDKGVENVARLFGRFGASDNPAVQFVDASDQTEARDFRIEITRAAERAAVTADHAAPGAGLAADEHLTFLVDDKSFVAALSAGDTLADVIEKLNARFSTEGAALEALNQNGALLVRSVAYGSEQAFSLTSDQDAAAAGQLGVGTTQRSAQGVDVAGTINGLQASGSGRTLRGGTGSNYEGLELLVTATAPTTASVSFTRGLADRLTETLDVYLNEENGAFQARQEGVGKTIQSLNKSIESMEKRIDNEAARMRRQFTAMESQLAQYQQMSSYLSQALSSLNTGRSSGGLFGS